MNLKKNKKGFTLVELLAVVVVLIVVIGFVTPTLSTFVKNGFKTQEDIVKDKVLIAAREYATSYDGYFLNSFVDVGDTSIIYKTSLLKAGLIDEDEISALDDFAGVKVELLDNDNMKYSLEYINNAPEEYSLEELYYMIQTNSNSIQTNSNSIQTNSNSINEINNKNTFLDAYPVGSVYISSTNTNPGTVHGGTWELIHKDYKSYVGNMASAFTANSTNVSSADEVYVIRNGQTVRMRIKIVTAVALADSTIELGTINFSALGFTTSSLSFLYYLGASDAANGISMASINNTSGLMSAVDVITKTSGGTIASGSTLYYDFTFPIASGNMIDSFCDEFYFKRTA